MVLRYEEARVAKPPIPVTVPPPRQPPQDTHPALRTPSTTSDLDGKKRDSGLAPMTSSKAREGSVSTVEDNVVGYPGISINFNNMATTTEAQPVALQLEDAPTTTAAPTTPKNEKVTTQTGKFWRRQSSKRTSPQSSTPEKSSDEEFSGITTPIHTESLLDEDFLDQLSFSKRGSMMLGGKKAVNGHIRQSGGRRYVLVNV
jgi:hypothetical protein